MTLEIPLEPLPNQSFSIDLDGSVYDIAIKSIDGQAMCVDLTRGGVPILVGSRCLAEEWLIPYEYLEDGNFLFYTADGQLPNYPEFGTTTGLVFYSAAELAVLRGRT